MIMIRATVCLTHIWEIIIIIISVSGRWLSDRHFWIIEAGSIWSERFLISVLVAVEPKQSVGKGDPLPVSGAEGDRIIHGV